MTLSPRQEHLPDVAENTHLLRTENMAAIDNCHTLRPSSGQTMRVSKCGSNSTLFRQHAADGCCLRGLSPGNPKTATPDAFYFEDFWEAGQPEQDDRDMSGGRAS